MEIIDENGIVIENPNLELGYLINDKKNIHHDAIISVQKQSHYETVETFENGKQVKEVVDVEPVNAHPAWDEEIQIQRYILFTEDELLQKLEQLKTEKIAQSKLELKSFLRSHPLQWIDGEYYSVTEEKQSLLTSNLAAYQISVSLGTPIDLTWNTTGEKCKSWTYENLASLSLDIVRYVKPLVSKQQDFEIQIKNCSTKKELDAIEIKYD